MKNNLIFFFLLFAACNDGYKKGPADMQYLIHHDEPGAAIKPGDYLCLHYIHRTENDSLLASSYDFDHAVIFPQRKPAFRGDIFTGLALLSEGDSATFKLNFDSMQIILNVPKPPSVKGKYLLFTVKIEKVIPKGTKPDSVFNKEVRAFLAEDAAGSKAAEAGKISRYIAEHKLSPQQTSSGLYYIVDRQGSGPLAKPGDTVKFDHTGRYITGRIFDSSMKDTAMKAGIFDLRRPYTPTVAVAGQKVTVPGVDEALLHFPQGTKVTLILPSALAYGGDGNAVFPPYTPLVFGVEILDIVKSGNP